MKKRSIQNPRVEVVCIGTELLTGKVNTHTAFLGGKLASAGLSITREHTVGDDPSIMREVFKEAWRRSDVVISAGGLGPTFDDITRDVWSDVVGRKLKMDERIVDDIREKFQRRGIVMPVKNRRQGEVLDGAIVIFNNFGTAPGQCLRIGKKTLVLLPGPARELYPMVDDFLMPKLHELFPHSFSVQKSLLIVGVPESKIDEMVRPLVSRYSTLKGCRVIHGILASQSIITVKFTVEGKDEAKVHSAAGILEALFRKRLGDVVFGHGDDTLEGVVGDLLASVGQTLAVAESCTGGLISKLLTDRPGASGYLLEGIVTYSNQSKIGRLGVGKAKLERFGAVSAQVAKEMALGIRKKTGAGFGLSVTGIAGPGGGTDQKPVGLVFICCAGPRRTMLREFKFDGNRSWIRHRSALMALDILRREVLTFAPPRA